MASVEKSSSNTIDAVLGENTASLPGGAGVHGISEKGPGVHAVSEFGRGLEASSTMDYGVRASSVKSAGLRASSKEGRGAEGWSDDHEGVVGTSKTGVGVYGTGTGPVGVVGDTEKGAGKGVEGRSTVATGVSGVSRSGRGVEGWSESAYGVAGESQSSAGVRGTSRDGRGVEGTGTTGGFFDGSFEGVHAVSHHAGAAGVAGYNDNTGPAIFGKSKGGPAGYFDGDLVVTGVIHMTKGDYAEDFTVSTEERIEPGAVMVLDDAGGVRLSRHAYDKRVAGIVSGAGHYKPAVILDHDHSKPNRLPLALMGKAFCWADATGAPIEIGDLLTTSPVPGHAMKATDSSRALGAIIGKALQPLASGRGLVPVLVRLQ